MFICTKIQQLILVQKILHLCPDHRPPFGDLWFVVGNGCSMPCFLFVVYFHDSVTAPHPGLAQLLQHFRLFCCVSVWMDTFVEIMFLQEYFLNGRIKRVFWKNSISVFLGCFESLNSELFFFGREKPVESLYRSFLLMWVFFQQKTDWFVDFIDVLFNFISLRKS